jgi:dihydroorotate dehydrogenase
VICTNTTVDRDTIAGHPHAAQAGGLSGAPLRAKATRVLRGMAQRLDGKVPLIGVGGILDGRDAAEKIAAGASLVQFYTGMIYRGPALIGDCVAAIRARRAGSCACAISMNCPRCWAAPNGASCRCWCSAAAAISCLPAISTAWC